MLNCNCMITLQLVAKGKLTHKKQIWLTLVWKSRLAPALISTAAASTFPLEQASNSGVRFSWEIGIITTTLPLHMHRLVTLSRISTFAPLSVSIAAMWEWPLRHAAWRAEVPRCEITVHGHIMFTGEFLLHVPCSDSSLLLHYQSIVLQCQHVLWHMQ